MRRCLIEHGNIAIPPETYVLGDIIRFFLSNCKVGWMPFVYYALGKIGLHPEFSRTFGYSLTPLGQELFELPKDQRSLEVFFQKFYQDYARHNGQTVSRWGEKTPLNVFSIWEISKVFPDARFIWMIRNPVDVVASYLRMGDCWNVEKTTRRWNLSNKILEEFASSFRGQVLLIEYEAFLKDYQKILTKIFSHCDLEYNPTPKTVKMGDVEVLEHHANVTHDINTHSIGRGYSELSKEVVSLVERLTLDRYERLIAQSKSI